MAPATNVYIAGVGFSPSQSSGSSAESVTASLISAATKALLDAGVTYDDVTKGVRSSKDKNGNCEQEAFNAFDDGNITVHEVEKGSELNSSFDLVKNQNAQCVLTMAIENTAAIAFIIVSENFLWRHPYLKDSATTIRELDSPKSKSGGQKDEGLYNLCKIVWTLRGWSQSKGTEGKQKNLRYNGASSSSFELSRADGNATPEWKEVEQKHDGKYRLGHNPATQTAEISQEDFEAVKAFGKTHDKRKDLDLFDRKGGDRAALAKL